MKLTFFTTQTLPKSQRSDEAPPKITFGKGGVIALNKKACEQMKIAPGDKLSLALDDSSQNKQWYLFKDPQHGYEIRDKEFKKSGTACFNHSTLRKKFYESYEFDETETYGFELATEAKTMTGSKTEYWLIDVVLAEETEEEETK